MCHLIWKAQEEQLFCKYSDFFVRGFRCTEIKMGQLLGKILFFGLFFFGEGFFELGRGELLGWVGSALWGWFFEIGCGFERERRLLLRKIGFFL